MATGYTPPGATCCCEGGLCGCDWPADLCLTVDQMDPAVGCHPLDPALDCTAGLAAAFVGTSWDLPEQPPVVEARDWVSDPQDCDGWTCVAGVRCYPGDGSYGPPVEVTVSQTSGVVARVATFTPDGSLSLAEGCGLPVTVTGTWSGYQNVSGFPLYTWGPVAGQMTISAGPCGALMAATPATAAPARGYRPPPPARPRICLYAERVEFRAGCSGFRCQHRCTSPDPGVRAALGDTDIVLPADECQTCSGYTAR
jgi:hypothetical protein